MDLIKPRCKICSTEPVPRLSSHYFIKMEDLEAEVAAWYKDAKAKGVWSKNAQQLTEGWLKMGLQQRCMTRDLSWGVPVPFAGWEEKVLYVWVRELAVVYLGRTLIARTVRRTNRLSFHHG
jgi:methionyl-tRNA synthetase